MSPPSLTALKPTWSPNAYTKAYRFAADAHHGQLFPGTDLPYIMHISFVSMEVIAALTHEQDQNGNLAVQCALLHDVIEDTDVGYEDVRDMFGTAVADGVLSLTKNPNLPKDEQMADSLHRIRQRPPEIWLVKLADRITNLAQPPHTWDRKKKVRYQAEARQIHSALHKASPYLSQRLLEKIKAYKTYF